MGIGYSIECEGSDIRIQRNATDRCQIALNMNRSYVRMCQDGTSGSADGYGAYIVVHPDARTRVFDDNRSNIAVCDDCAPRILNPDPANIVSDLQG